MPKLNSTHAAWLNFAGAICTAVGGVLSALPPGTSATATGLLLANAVLHILLPDAPKGP